MNTQIEKVRPNPNPEDNILSRKQVQEIQEDPAKMEIVARLMGAVNLENLFKQMQDPAVNMTVKLEFQKLLNKMGKLEPEQKNSGSAGAQVVINITRARDREDSMVIEGSAV